MDIYHLIIVAILIALTGFFVATEFAIVKIRSTRIDQLVSEGNKNAIAAKTVISNLDEYLSACQLGITITALGLGWLGGSTIEDLFYPLITYFNLSESLSTGLAIFIAFTTITFLHGVIGELTPKTMAVQKAEEITLLFSKPIILFYKLMYPIIKALNGSARLLSRLFGFKPVADNEMVHTEEELRMILSESYKSGEINQSEYKYVNNIFEFNDRIAKEIMVPRTEMVGVEKDQIMEEFIATATEENYTRYPIYAGDKDHIVGMINMKEVLTDFVKKRNIQEPIIKYARPVIKVMESMPIHDLLAKMQKERVHMAIIVDEYGGTAGLVTVEDIIEEIVGDIRDEFDHDEVPEIKKVNEHKTIIDGKVLIEEVNDLFGLEIDDTDIDTISGWILTEKMEAKEGDSIALGEYEFKILEMEGYHVKSLEIVKMLGQKSTA
ncbi:hemolysin family protein [Neobacillus sp. D3-1R]|uniref:hemolysin family protein n=1 Tax=Neobacillus sp. D3-1R TaxID=3445778 RepID=UPI003F9FE078